MTFLLLMVLERTTLTVSESLRKMAQKELAYTFIVTAEKNPASTYFDLERHTGQSGTVNESFQEVLTHSLEAAFGVKWVQLFNNIRYLYTPGDVKWPWNSSTCVRVHALNSWKEMAPILGNGAPPNGPPRDRGLSSLLAVMTGWGIGAN